MWISLWTLLGFAALVASQDAPIPDLDNDFAHVSCGSAVKLTLFKAGHKLHSHDIRYGSGSGQQSVTAHPNSDDPNSYFIVDAPLGKHCRRGEAVSCKDIIRLRHLNTRCYLHSHLHRSPLSNQQEVSCYERQDTGDHWRVVCVESKATKWIREQRIRLQHVDTSAYLSARPSVSYPQPISGQLEVAGSKSGSGDETLWTAQFVQFMIDRLPDELWQLILRYLVSTHLVSIPTGNGNNTFPHTRQYSASSRGASSSRTSLLDSAAYVYRIAKHQTIIRRNDVHPNFLMIWHRSLIAFGATCRHAQRWVSDDTLWRDMALFRWPSLATNPDKQAGATDKRPISNNPEKDISWFALYQRRHLEDKITLERLNIVLTRPTYRLDTLQLMTVNADDSQDILRRWQHFARQCRLPMKGTLCAEPLTLRYFIDIILERLHRTQIQRAWTTLLDSSTSQVEDGFILADMAQHPRLHSEWIQSELNELTRLCQFSLQQQQQTTDLTQLSQKTKLNHLCQFLFIEQAFQLDSLTFSGPASREDVLHHRLSSLWLHSVLKHRRGCAILLAVILIVVARQGLGLELQLNTKLLPHVFIVCPTFGRKSAQYLDMTCASSLPCLVSRMTLMQRLPGLEQALQNDSELLNGSLHSQIWHSYLCLVSQISRLGTSRKSCRAHYRACIERTWISSEDSEALLFRWRLIRQRYFYDCLDGDVLLDALKHSVYREQDDRIQDLRLELQQLRNRLTGQDGLIVHWREVRPFHELEDALLPDDGEDAMPLFRVGDCVSLHAEQAQRHRHVIVGWQRTRQAGVRIRYQVMNEQGEQRVLLGDALVPLRNDFHTDVTHSTPNTVWLEAGPSLVDRDEPEDDDRDWQSASETGSVMEEAVTTSSHVENSILGAYFSHFEKNRFMMNQETISLYPNDV